MKPKAMKQRIILVLLTAVLIPWNATAVYRAERSSGMEAFIKNTSHEIENLLVKSLLEITQGKLDEVLNNIDKVISVVVNFKLANLVVVFSQQREGLVRAIEQWRSDWQSKRTEIYLSHYATDFFTEDMNLAAWAAHKRRVQQDKSAIRVKLSELSFFRYPNTQKIIAVVNFNQDYQVNQLNNKMRKLQYWTLEQERWKILYEGAA